MIEIFRTTHGWVYAVRIWRLLVRIDPLPGLDSMRRGLFSRGSYSLMSGGTVTSIPRRDGHWGGAIARRFWWRLHWVHE